MKMRIGTKLELWCITGLLCALAVTGATAYYVARRALVNHIHAHLESVAESRARHVSTFLNEQKKIIVVTASCPALAAGLRTLRAGDQQDRASVTARLNARLALYVNAGKDTGELFLLDRDGKVVASTNREDIGQDKSMDAYFLGARTGPFIKDAYRSAGTGNPSLAISAPVRATQGGELLGVLVARIGMDELDKIMTDHTGLGETGETYLINKYGYMITPSRFRGETFVKQKADGMNAHHCLDNNASPSRGMDRDHHEQDSYVFVDYRGVRVLGAHARIEEMNWGLLAEIDVDEALAPVARLRTGLLIFGGFFAAAAVAGTWFFARRIARPICELRAGAQRIGAGDLAHRIDIRTGDEIEQLAHEFNRMALSLSDSYASIKQKVADRTADLAKEIEERKRAEERLRRYADDLKRANEEIKQFAYIVSHDLRAPLVNLKGFAAELRSALETICSGVQSALPHLDEDQRKALRQACGEDVPEALGFIESSVTRMDNFINAVLTLSRVGRRELKFERLNVEEIARATLNDLKHQSRKNGLKVTVHPLPEIVADRTCVEQIMGNILANAVNYLDPKRPGEIEISGERGERETTFRIRDNGRGIAEDDMPKVFAPFRRAGRQDVKGEGMGLAYVQAMVRSHGGRVWCESKPGEGATFFFTIANRIREEENRA